MPCTYNHRMVTKHYPHKTVYLIVVRDFDVDALEEYDRPLHSFDTEAQAQAWLTAYYAVSDDVPF